jgi:carotenoid cleavage dioxygenase-like enzyme
MRLAADPTRDAFLVPVAAEVEAFDLPVSGALPPELTGWFMRNGPNPRPGTPPLHWFLGDGMLHGVRLERGAARWYRNRWVRTSSFVDGAPFIRPDGSVDLRAGVANTSVLAHAGRVYALVESSFPYEVTTELETVGPCDFSGRLATPFTAHPKLCPRTGELHAFGYRMFPKGVTYHRFDADGTLAQSVEVPVRGATMMHDFALTERYVVFLDLPVVFDPTLAGTGAMPYRWDEHYGARLGVLHRDDPTRAPVWFEIEPCYVFHVLNAYDDEATITLDVVRYPNLWREREDWPPTTLHRFTIDLANGRVGEAGLDERSVEFPRADPRRTTMPYRFGYAAQRDETRGVVRKYDLARGSANEHDFGAGRMIGEPVFVPAADDRGEDAGWLLLFVYDATRDASDFVVLDASDVARGPLATVALPQRVPAGFHGSWIAEGEVGAPSGG